MTEKRQIGYIYSIYSIYSILTIKSKFLNFLYLLYINGGYKKAKEKRIQLKV